MTAEIVILPVTKQPAPIPRTARSLVENYLRAEDMPVDIPGDVLNRADYLLLWLWISGYRVVPIQDEVAHG